MTAPAAGNPLLPFVERYGPKAGERGPEMFVREVFGVEEIDDWQLVLLRAYGGGERKISIRSCHGPGKTAGAAWCAAHQLVCRFPQKTAVTAPTGGQMYDAFYAELKKWMKKLPPQLQILFEIKADRIELRANKDESFLTARTAKSEQPEALQGIHCDDGFVLLIVDEASGVPEPIFEAAIGSMSGTNVCTILLSNPVRSTGYFANSQTSTPGFVRLHITAVPSEDGEYPEDTYYSERPGEQFVQDVIDEYGEDSSAYRVRCLGEFPKSDEDTIIAFELIEGATKRDVVANPKAPVIWGVDVARGGGDLSTIARRQGNILLGKIDTMPEVRDVMKVVGFVKVMWDDLANTPDQRPVEICVDAIGLGAGVADRLRELGLPATAINVAENPALAGERYRNLRTELWYSMKDWFLRRDCYMEKDDKLIAELAAQKYKILDSTGKVIATPKSDMRKFIRRSPDRADAFMLTFASNASIAMFGSGTKWNTALKRNIKGIV